MPLRNSVVGATEYINAAFESDSDRLNRWSSTRHPRHGHSHSYQPRIIVATQNELNDEASRVDKHHGGGKASGSDGCRDAEYQSHSKPPKRAVQRSSTPPVADGSQGVCYVSAQNFQTHEKTTHPSNGIITRHNQPRREVFYASQQNHRRNSVSGSLYLPLCADRCAGQNCSSQNQYVENASGHCRSNSLPTAANQCATHVSVRQTNQLLMPLHTVEPCVKKQDHCGPLPREESDALLGHGSDSRDVWPRRGRHSKADESWSPGSIRYEDPSLSPTSSVEGHLRCNGVVLSSPPPVKHSVTNSNRPLVKHMSNTMKPMIESSAGPATRHRSSKRIPSSSIRSRSAPERTEPPSSVFLPITIRQNLPEEVKMTRYKQAGKAYVRTKLPDGNTEFDAVSVTSLDRKFSSSSLGQRISRRNSKPPALPQARERLMPARILESETGELEDSVSLNLPHAGRGASDHQSMTNLEDESNGICTLPRQKLSSADAPRAPVDRKSIKSRCVSDDALQPWKNVANLENTTAKKHGRPDQLAVGGCSIAMSVSSCATSTTCGSRDSQTSVTTVSSHLSQPGNQLPRPLTPKGGHISIAVEDYDRMLSNKDATRLESPLNSGWLSRVAQRVRSWCSEKYDSQIWMQGALWLSLGCVFLVMFVILLGLFAGPSS